MCKVAIGGREAAEASFRCAVMQATNAKIERDDVKGSSTACFVVIDTLQVSLFPL